ncbi:MAG TPA: alpha/beta hydrolase [Rhodopila sp.]|uniref:alpha/beta fold hydrolase n=1 Tax=Rhodopila sp. TaxID=2480087 RepID=UPI002BD1031C|nr:alpha/beta hydrolase [Rhodopila sp.]HVY16233.1 alpha/beta hydrolase [Rhodopila sp.]
MRRQLAVEDGTVSIVTVIDETHTGPAPALVLLPSSSRDSLDFDDIAERFAAVGYRVLRPQPRGMAGSTGPMTGLTLHDFARDVALAIERLAGGPAFVLGHAFGQWIGRSVAADHPHLVRGVILAAAAAKSANPALREELAKCVDVALPDAVRLAALRVAFFAPDHDPASWLDNWHPDAAKAQRAASAATPVTDWWTAGSAPVLDIQAEHDPWRPAETRNGIRDDLGADRVTVVLIQDASHALIPEQPEAVVQAVLAWTRRIAGEPA